MKQFLDTDIHQEPMSAAVVSYWLAESHAKHALLTKAFLFPGQSWESD